MSRVAKKEIAVPSGVQIAVNDGQVTVKGSKGTLSLTLNRMVRVAADAGVVRVQPSQETTEQWMMAGTYRALINNMVVGVSTGFSRKLEMVGVGYRAQAKGDVLSLSLGFSHPLDYQAPEGITITTPSQTEIIVSGCDKQKVGQVAAEIRAYRPPEPYKGKGVKYSDEIVVRKETKKKK